MMMRMANATGWATSRAACPTISTREEPECVCARWRNAFSTMTTAPSTIMPMPIARPANDMRLADMPKRCMRMKADSMASGSVAITTRADRSSPRAHLADRIAGVFLLLFLAFSSVRDAALVMLNLPLALIGGVARMYVAGGVLSVATMIGFITLFGIATRNGVMMIAHIRHLMENEGVGDPREAVVRGAQERLVPILMTALAARLALVPLAISSGQARSSSS